MPPEDLFLAHLDKVVTHLCRRHLRKEECEDFRSLAGRPRSFIPILPRKG